MDEEMRPPVRQKAIAQFRPTAAQEVPALMSALTSARAPGDRSTYAAMSRNSAVNVVQDAMVFGVRVRSLRNVAGHATRLSVVQADESLLGEIPPQIREHLVQVAHSLQGWTESLQTIDRLQDGTDVQEGDDQHPLREAAARLGAPCLSERVQAAYVTASQWDRPEIVVLGRSMLEWFRMQDVLAPGSELSKAASALNAGATQAQVLARWAHRKWDSEDTRWFLREVIADERPERPQLQGRLIARAKKTSLLKMAASGVAYADVTGHQVLTVVACSDGTFHKLLPGGILQPLSGSAMHTPVLIVPLMCPAIVAPVVATLLERQDVSASLHPGEARKSSCARVYNLVQCCTRVALLICV